jgi:hypothetical protein
MRSAVELITPNPYVPVPTPPHVQARTIAVLQSGLNSRKSDWIFRPGLPSKCRHDLFVDQSPAGFWRRRGQNRVHIAGVDGR